MTKSVDDLFNAIMQSAENMQTLVLSAPTSEWAVVFLLGQLSARGHFRFVRGDGGFPDCTLAIEDVNIRIEIELKASQFILHKHPLDGCDAVICWTNDKKLQIPTLELSSLFPNVKTAVFAEIDHSGKRNKVAQTLADRYESIVRLFDTTCTVAKSMPNIVLSAPTSEWAVVFLLGQISAGGHFLFVCGDGGFPDCTFAIEDVNIRIEVELKASQFIRHKHPMDGCDAVICWTNDKKLPIPTLELSPLFPRVKPAVLAEIEHVGKRNELVQIFENLNKWLTRRGLSSTGGAGLSHTNSLAFSYNGRALCAIQFCGGGCNEYVRFRFYKKALQYLSSSPEIISVLRNYSDGITARYSTSATEERIDLYPGAETIVPKIIKQLESVMAGILSE